VSEDIVSAQLILDEVKLRLGVTNIPRYKFRRLFSWKYKTFFDCRDDAQKCLEEVLHNENYSRFIVYSIIKDENGDLQIMDVSYASLGKETLERFVNRYPIQLQSACIMALQLSGNEYREFLGVSYEE
jgi:hypothetical protein